MFSPCFPAFAASSAGSGGARVEQMFKSIQQLRMNTEGSTTALCSSNRRKVRTEREIGKTKKKGTRFELQDPENARKMRVSDLDMRRKR
jgi:hypothetical protein